MKFLIEIVKINNLFQNIILRWYYYFNDAIKLYISVTKTPIYFDGKSKYVACASYKQSCYTTCKMFLLLHLLFLEIFCPGPKVFEIQILHRSPFPFPEVS